MLKALDEQKQNGVDIKVIGAACRGVAVTALIASTNNGGEKDLRKLEMRLLAASVIDGREAFVGSQSLRKAELDSRREVGLNRPGREGGAPPARYLPRRLGCHGIHRSQSCHAEAVDEDARRAERVRAGVR